MHTVKAASVFMKVELTIDQTKEIPNGAVTVLKKEPLKRLPYHFSQCHLVLRRAVTDGVTLCDGKKEVSMKVEEILQRTRENADDWFY